MASDFFEKMQALKGRVGKGELKGTVSFSTPYAWNQHEARWINFMGRYGPKEIKMYHGPGGPKYLSGPNLAHAQATKSQLAAGFVRCLAGEDGALVASMRSAQGEVKDAAIDACPMETGRLRASARLQVFDDGALVYDDAF